MLNPLLIGRISRVPRPTVALAAPSSRTVRIHLTVHRCAPFILYFAFAKYRLTVTPSNEIKDTSLPLSFSFSWPRGRDSRAWLRGSSCHLAYYSTPLSSLADELPGLFFLREPLPALRELCFSFLSLPRPLRPRSRSRFFRSFFLSFPLFLLLHPETRSRRIMQHITEKSKQARRNSPGSDCPDLRVARLPPFGAATFFVRIALGSFSWRTLIYGESWLADIRLILKIIIILSSFVKFYIQLLICESFLKKGIEKFSPRQKTCTGVISTSKSLSSLIRMYMNCSQFRNSKIYGNKNLCFFEE